MRKYIVILSVFSALSGIFLNVLPVAVIATETVRQDAVPTNILDYGKLGKILKKGNLVTAIPNPDHHPATFALSGLRPDKTLVEITLKVEKPTFFQLLWAQKDEKYHPSRSSGVLLNHRVHRYRLYLPGLKEKTRIRIDPSNSPGEILIQNITFKSLHHLPIRLNSPEKLQTLLIPIRNTAKFEATHDGVRIVAKGNDPQLEIVIEPKQHVTDKLFKKKRKQSEYLYKAINSTENQFPSRLGQASEHLETPYPIISITADNADLFHPDNGLIPNKHMRGRKWEKPATVSYYEKGALLFESNAGLRIHGGKRLLLANSFRLYFRDAYGKAQFEPGILFSPGTEPLKRLVVHHTAWPSGWPLNNIFAYEIARKMGCVTPEVKLAHLVLNGKDQGLYFLTPHQGDTQLESFFGHADFVAFRHKSTLTKDSVSFYEDDYLALFRSDERPLDLALIDQRIDLDNLARHLFSFVYCATSDYCQGVVARDNRLKDPKIFWINWDMDQSFADINRMAHKRRTYGNRNIWEQPGWGRFLSETGTYCKRKDLFRQLVSEYPQYGQQVVKISLDILNHRVTKAFLLAKVDEYEKLLGQWGDDNEGYFKKLRGFFYNRHEFILADMQKWFNLGPSYQCRIKGPEGIAYNVDGFTKEGQYEGDYFKGMRVKISLADPSTRNFSHWLVNGKKVDDQQLVITVKNNMTISPVFGSNQ